MPKAKSADSLLFSNEKEIFADRVEPRKAFWSAYYSVDKDDIRVINYYGVGGIGKTTLLKKIAEEVYETGNNAVVHYRLDKNQDKTDFLFSFSREIMACNKKCKFPLFHYAYTQILLKRGLSENEIVAKLSSRERDSVFTPKSFLSVFADFVPFAGNTFQLIMGEIIDGIGSRIKDRNYDVLKKEIDTMEVESVENKLQVYFAKDAEEYLKNAKAPFVIMLDGYEFLVNYLSKSDLADSEERWLCGEEGLVWILPHTVWVVAGRNKLAWNEELLPEEDIHHLENIPNTDTLSYFVQAEIREDLRDKLLELTDGIPVYMDLCKNINAGLLSQGKNPQIDDFGVDTVDLANRFFQNMDPGQQKALRFLCCIPQIWDDEMVDGICRKEGLEFKYRAVLSAHIDEIKKQSMVDQIGGSYRILDVIRNLIQTNTDEDERYEIGSKTIDYLWGIAFDKNADGERRCVAAENCIRLFVEYISQDGFFAKEDDWNGLIDIIDILRVFGKYDAAIRMIQLCYTCKDTMSEENIASYIVEKVQILVCYAKYREALRLISFYEDGETRSCQEENRLRILGEKSEILRAMGEYTAAKEWAEYYYSICSNCLGENHFMTIKALFNLANSYSETKEHEKAAEIRLTVYEKYKECFGEEHPETLRALNNLACSYSDLGDYEKSRELNREVYEKRKEILGETHPMTISSINNLANNYYRTGEYINAKELHEFAYEKNKEIYGEKHFDTLLSLNNLAHCLFALGEKQKAVELEAIVYETRSEVLGEDHPDTKLAFKALYEMKGE